MLAITGSLQRCTTYAKTATEAQRRSFRTDLAHQLQAVAEDYLESPSEDVHLTKIIDLASTLTGKHPSSLHAGRYRIGSAQKALNLYLKYLWCAGRIAMPPHCPFDGVILDSLGRQQDHWTSCDDIEIYKHWVATAHCVAGATPLALWELEVFNAGRKAQHTTKSAPCSR